MYAPKPVVDESRIITIHHVYADGEEEKVLDTTTVTGNVGQFVTIEPETAIQFEGVTYEPITEAYDYEVQAENDVQTVLYAPKP
ncbi:hypothetical protein, partial [Paenibacillus sp. J23TS9]|uniref:hypothetical protein n=1 Tax=Paenibacillus sp. J23TS9 TaxID=2807193 RepID=UPI001BCE6E1F